MSLDLFDRFRNALFENDFSLPLIEHLPQEYDFKFATVYKSSHLFLAESRTDGNEIFHYIRDAEQFVLLFKHDEPELNEFQSGLDKDVKFTDMRILEDIDTLLVLYSNGTLKTFQLPDVIYNNKSDLQNVKQIETIDSSRFLFLTNDGDLNICTFSRKNGVLKLRKTILLHNIHNFSKPVLKNENELLFVAVNSESQYILFDFNTLKDNSYSQKLIFSSQNDVASMDGVHFLGSVSDIGFLYSKHQPNCEPKFVNIDFQGNTVTELELNSSSATVENFKLYRFILDWQHGSAEILSDATDNNGDFLKNVYELDNYLSLDWNTLASSERGAKLLEIIKEKYTMQPLVQDENGNKMAIDVQLEQEKLFIQKNTLLKSRKLMNFEIDDRNSLWYVLDPPIASRLTSFQTGTLSSCDEILETLNHENISEFDIIQLQYTKYYKLLMKLFHDEFLDEKCFELWLEFSRSKNSAVDPKLLFYLLNWKVYGDIWINGGLIKIIEKLKILKLENKIKNKLSFISAILLSLTDEKLNSTVSDIYNLKLTATLKYIDFVLADSGELSTAEVLNFVDFENFGDRTIQHIEGQDKSEKKTELLMFLYERKSSFEKLLNLLCETERYEKLENVVSTNFKILKTKLEKSYFLEILIKLINNSEKADEKFLKQIKTYVTENIKDPAELKDFVSALTNSGVKFQVLESTIKNSSKAMNSNTISLTCDFYLLEIENMLMKNKTFMHKLDDSVNDFSKDMDFKNKSSIEDFCSGLLQDASDLSNMKHKWISFIEALTLVENGAEYKSLVQKMFVSKFSENKLLYVLFNVCEILPHKEQVEIYLNYNDFRNILSFFENLDADEADLLLFKVLENYVDHEIIFLRFLNVFYKQNKILSFHRVLDAIPDNFRVSLLSDLIVENNRKLESEETVLRLHIKLQSSANRNQ